MPMRWLRNLRKRKPMRKNNTNTSLERSVIVPHTTHKQCKAPDGYHWFNRDWAISDDGSMIQVEEDYPIHHSRLEENDWFLHLMEKAWFDANTFIPAYLEACARSGLKNVVVLTTYQKL